VGLIEDTEGIELPPLASAIEEAEASAASNGRTAQVHAWETPDRSA